VSHTFRGCRGGATCEALLRSPFTTPDVLRALPAHRVLDSGEQAELTASMIVDVCGDDPDRWEAVAGRLDSARRKTVTFEACAHGAARYQICHSNRYQRTRKSAWSDKYQLLCQHGTAQADRHRRVNLHGDNCR